MAAMIEMRTYRTKAGRRAEFLRIFHAKTVPAHEAIGMKVIGPFLSIDDPEVFFWMRVFPDASVRDEMKSAFYEGALWREELEAILLPMLDKYEVVLVEDAVGLAASLGRA
jgi:hypothetical protein